MSLLHILGVDSFGHKYNKHMASRWLDRNTEIWLSNEIKIFKLNEKKDSLSLVAQIIGTMGHSESWVWHGLCPLDLLFPFQMANNWLPMCTSRSDVIECGISFTTNKVIGPFLSYGWGLGNFGKTEILNNFILGIISISEF